MHRILRLVFALMLALALPLQGYAAASMAACGRAHAAGHREAAQVERDVRAGAQRDMHHGPHHAMHGATHDDADASTAHAGSPDADGAHAGFGKFAKSECSVCAACCAAMAMPVAWLEFDAVSPAQSFATQLPTADAAFLTAGPERPPRTASA